MSRSRMPESRLPESRLPKTGRSLPPLPPITDFESCQRVRPMLFRRITDGFGIHQYCPNKTCRRQRACQEPRALCFYAMLEAMPDELRRTLAYSIRNCVNGLGPEEAFKQAQALVALEEGTPVPDLSAGL